MVELPPALGDISRRQGGGCGLCWDMPEWEVPPSVTCFALEFNLMTKTRRENSAPVLPKVLPWARLKTAEQLQTSLPPPARRNPTLLVTTPAPLGCCTGAELGHPQRFTTSWDNSLGQGLVTFRSLKFWAGGKTFRVMLVESRKTRACETSSVGRSGGAER